MPSRLSAVWPFAAALLAFAGAGTPAPAEETALDRYVREPDAAYAWKVEKIVPGNPSTTYLVRLRSQGWRTEKEVDRPVWEHWLTVIKPAKPAHRTAFLLIGGGSNDRPAPGRPDETLLAISRATNSVVAELRMVPNQPLVFHKDGKKRTEDDLIGYAWGQFLKTGDATWLPRLPMVKSAVRAMDAIQELTAGEQGGGVKVEKFVVAGGSKRGWTTWMTGAADPRVAAIVPIVIDVVNVDRSMRNHVQVYGFWANAIGDYYRHGITRQWDNPKLAELYRVVDPYYYRDRLTMPKYVLNASGDQFFTPDSSRFYYDDLKGEKLLRYVPNADHSLRGTDAYASLIAFYHTVLNDTPRPRYSWTFEEDGSIRVKAGTRPQEVKVWAATNPAARDFRVDTIGRAFEERKLTDQGDGVYVARVPAPAKGFCAFFVELTYDVGAPAPLKVTTAVRVLPDRLPHAGIDPNKAPYEGELPRPR